MFMSEEEQAIFERVLSNAFEDLINTRPEEPIMHFCKSLLSQVMSEDIDKEMMKGFRMLGLDPDRLMGSGETRDGVTQETPMNTLQLPTFGAKRRGDAHTDSVAGESLSKDELAWNPVKIEKTPEDKEFLRPILKKNLLLAHLTEQDIEAVIEVLEQVDGEDGFEVVAEGDIGDGCYVVEEGRLICTMKSEGLRCEYGPVIPTQGDTFGELALMYGNQRAATITIVLSRSQPDNNTFYQLISNIEAFGMRYTDSMGNDELANLAKAAQHVRFYPGDVIVEEDDVTGMFQLEWFLYIIEEGTVELIRRGEVVHELIPGRYFGVVPMFNSKPAKATAKAKEQCKIYRLPDEVVKGLSTAVKDTLVKGGGNKYL